MRKQTTKLLISTALLSLYGISYAYIPTISEKTQINRFYKALDTIYYKNPSESVKLLSQINILEKSYIGNEATLYTLGELKTYLEFQRGKYFGRNVRVVDGDTIEVTINGVKEKVRFIGIDTPETEVGEEYYGKEATNYLKERIEGKDVYIETDGSQGERDKYKRFLGFVFSGTENLGETLIKEGYAYEYTYDKAYKYQDLYKNSEKYASENTLGLWDIANSSTDIESEVIEKTPTYTLGKGKYNASDDSYLNMGFTCNKRKYCSYMSSCDEVKYFFYVCGAKTFDRDQDGIPCENICGQE